MTKLELAKSLIEEKTVKGQCTLSKKKLGELLHKRYPSEFKSSDSGRTTIRQLTGSHGDYHRTDVVSGDWVSSRIRLCTATYQMDIFIPLVA